MAKKIAMNKTEVRGTTILHNCPKVTFFSTPCSSSLEVLNQDPVFVSEWDCSVSLDSSLLLVLMSLLITRMINTIIGIRSPWRSQISMSFRLESAGSSSWIELYKVYMTRFEVRATIISASKCTSSINRVISAANTRHVDGMKTEIQNDCVSLSKCIAKLILFFSVWIQHFFTMNLLSVRFKGRERFPGTKSSSFLRFSGSVNWKRY